jgi:hypothetical protein
MLGGLNLFFLLQRFRIDVVYQMRHKELDEHIHTDDIYTDVYKTVYVVAYSMHKIELKSYIHYKQMLIISK